MEYSQFNMWKKFCNLVKRLGVQRPLYWLMNLYIWENNLFKSVQFKYVINPKLKLSSENLNVVEVLFQNTICRISCKFYMMMSNRKWNNIVGLRKCQLASYGIAGRDIFWQLSYAASCLHNFHFIVADIFFKYSFFIARWWIWYT